jgi:hypothetical protein
LEVEAINEIDKVVDKEKVAYLKSVSSIFRAAMKIGNLRVALQAKDLEGRCRGMLVSKRPSGKQETGKDLDSMPTDILEEILRKAREAD